MFFKIMSLFSRIISYEVHAVSGTPYDMLRRGLPAGLAAQGEHKLWQAVCKLICTVIAQWLCAYTLEKQDLHHRHQWPHHT